jgi:undecaprenyl-phosphate 4-deoxy-4-formamido-L-arabinose transferase
MIDISVVIPVFNNENSLGLLIPAIQRALYERFSYEIILIDDGSSDNSWKTICELVSNNRFVLGIKHKGNYGQENAKMAGLRSAKGNYIVFMDADFQHNPNDIPELHKICASGADVCYANFTNNKGGFIKRLGGFIYNALSVIFLNKPRGIYLSSFNMMNKKTAEKIILHTTPILNLDSILLLYTTNVSQINTLALNSLNKKTNYNYKKLIQLFFTLLPGYSTKPLRLILFAGVVLFIGSFFLLVGKLFFSLPLSFYQTFILLLFSFFMLVLGVIGEYLGKIYILLHSAKQYEIEETKP